MGPVKCKGIELSPLYRSKLYTSSHGRPFHSDTNLTYPGSTPRRLIQSEYILMLYYASVCLLGIGETRYSNCTEGKHTCMYMPM